MKPNWEPVFESELRVIKSGEITEKELREDNGEHDNDQ